MLYKKSCYILIIILCFCTILLTGCDKDKSFILFASGEITPENFSMGRCKKAFKIGERIDFLLYNPKPLKHNVIRLQVLKVNFVEPSFNYSIAYGRDINIDISLNYATDHFYLYDQGYYMLRIYSPEDYDMPVAESGFTVE